MKINKVNKDNFVKHVCKIIKDKSMENIEKKGGFIFVLSGGKTPEKIFIELAVNYKESIDWTKVHFFWLDERCVKSDHEDSNYKLAYDNLISKLDKVGSVHRIRGELTPEVAAIEYKKNIKDFFGKKSVAFDFILIGMGKDGHIASLFPNSNEMKKTNHFVLATDVAYSGCRRITLGLNLINKSRFKLLMVNNKAKNKVLNDNLNLPVNKLSQLNVIEVM
jgi:6-phosphogluconolactonase